MTTETEPYFELADIVAGFDQPGIELTEDAFAHLLEVANQAGGPPGLIHCTMLVLAAEGLVRKNERLAPGAVAIITTQELRAAARMRERNGAWTIP